VTGVTVDDESQMPVVVLRAVEDETWYLPIFIGGTEATAIASSVAGVRLPRPITHDLFANVLLIGEIVMDSGSIVSIADGTFVAAADFVFPDGERITFDARPSDIVALALRCEAPLYVARDVMIEAGGFAEEPIQRANEVDESSPPAAEPPELAATHRDAGQPMPLLSPDVRLEDLDPRVFGKYKM